MPHEHNCDQDNKIVMRHVTCTYLIHLIHADPTNPIIEICYMHITCTFFVHHFLKSTITFVRPGFNSCTTPSQQLHNNPSQESGPSVWDPPSCEGLLCSCCIGVVNLTFSL
jgi:hypothetical protein